MKKLWMMLSCGYLSFLQAAPDTFSLDRIEVVYDEILLEENRVLAQAGFSSSGSLTPLPSLPPAPSATPPPNPSNPGSMSGMLPFNIVNNSGVDPSQVYILVQGRVPIGGPQVFVDFNMSGVGSLHQVSIGDNGSTYSYPLTYFPTTTDGYKFYLPETDSFLVIISLNSKLNIPVNSEGIADPAFNDPNDPYNNYAIIWDQVEGAYVSTSPNVNVDATAVSFFSIPLYIYLSTPGPGSASNCGLTQNRNTILSYVKSCFQEVPPAAESAQWQKLLAGSGSTTYRVISTGKGMAGGYFDVNYLDNLSAYGYSYLSDIWYGPISFYRRNPLSIEIPGGTTYTGTVQSNNSILFTSGPNQVTFGPPTLGPPYTSSTSFNILSGLSLVSSATSASDGIQVSKAFEEAIIAGIVPTTSLINASTLSTLSSFMPYYQVNPNLSVLGKSSGPWYDLYSAALHACGGIYTYAYDEPLWPSVLLASPTLESNTYIGITIGNTQ